MTTPNSTMAKTRWNLDPSHSEVTFKVKHLMITNVRGSVGKYDILCETDGDDFMTAKVSFTADVASITTNQPQRNAHLMSDDFFNVEKYPEIKFIATKYEKVDNDSYELYGDLTIRDITKPVKFDVEFAGIVVDAYGNTRAGFIVNGKINRKEYGLRWDAITEAGNVVAADEVRLHAEIQLIKS
ncbi:MAG TPA: YceI family protein [Chitinophagales bacterium]|nr:YceI family protein [Chitinophagales bacterium]